MAQRNLAEFVCRRSVYLSLPHILVLHLCCCIVLVSSASTGVLCPADNAERYDVQGEILSPNFPNPYPPNAQCKWHINIERNEVVTISFRNFSVEEADGSRCSADYLLIKGKIGWPYCGNQIPNPYISEQELDRVTITFTSDGSQQGTGFALEYFRGQVPAANPCDAETQFTCSNGKCIPKEWTCNNMDECGDRSDETVTVCQPKSTLAPFTGSTTTPPCPPHTMYCLTEQGQPICLPESKKCDGNPDCKNGVDEFGCTTVCQHDLQGYNGSFSSPNFPGDYPPNLDCSWTVIVDEGSIIQLRFVSFDVEQGYLTDYVTVYDGDSVDAHMIGSYYGYKSNDDRTSTHYPPAVIEGSGNRLFITFHTDSSSSNSGFNATFQTKGQCIDDQHQCSKTDLNCYSPKQQCDGILDCLRGEDEVQCGGCHAGQIPCNHVSSTGCYTQDKRCNGHKDCTQNGEDEMNCSALLCNAGKGLFMCRSQQCIEEQNMCDGNRHCDDGSDETNCPKSTKVITAAVIGSIICGLLLVAALSCTCKLYQLYHSDHHPPTHTSPLREIEDELMRREAPPSYTATMSSPHFDDAQRAFIESLQAAANARQESGGRAEPRRSSSHRISQLFNRGGNRSQDNSQAQQEESSANSPGSANTTQETLSNSDSTVSPARNADTHQESQPPADANEENSSPYTEIVDIPRPAQNVQSAPDSPSICTTDTDSDTNAEAELEQRDMDIIRAATNIRRIRLAGGMQGVIDHVTQSRQAPQLEDSPQADGENMAEQENSRNHSVQQGDEHAADSTPESETSRERVRPEEEAIYATVDTPASTAPASAAGEESPDSNNKAPELVEDGAAKSTLPESNQDIPVQGDDDDDDDMLDISGSHLHRHQDSTLIEDDEAPLIS